MEHPVPVRSKEHSVPSFFHLPIDAALPQIDWWTVSHVSPQFLKSRRDGQFSSKETAGIALLIFGIVAFVGYTFMRGSKVPEDLDTRPWIEHQFYTEKLAIDVPWKLKTAGAAKNARSTDFRTDGHRQDELEVVTSVSQPSAIAGEIDSAVDEMTRLLKAKTDGSIIFKETRKEEQVLGARAVALHLLGRNRWLRKYDVRILFFKVDGRCYQVHCNTPAGDPTGDKIWDRMRKSIRISGAAGAAPEKVAPFQRSWLPKGMERR